MGLAYDVSDANSKAPSHRVGRYAADSDADDDGSIKRQRLSARESRDNQSWGRG